MLVFVDETGDHNLNIVDPTYPLFILGALVIDEVNYRNLVHEIDHVKDKYFGSPVFILHSSELKRPLDKRSDPRNKPMLDPKVRSNFYSDMNKLVLESIDFGLVVCCIDKETMVQAYKYPHDPYHFSFENLLNRMLRSTGSVCKIQAEQRGSELDTELFAEYERLCRTGIRFYDSSIVKTRTSLELVNKKENHAGLQLVDLLIANIARSILGKEKNMRGNDLDPSLVRSKLLFPITFFPHK
ncbi:DUF3800 domain-containing protein [Patescibacteria group bacterium]|jgi:hypothetical protein|nr:DUF3800 domain-containing protein [Patescibacteria group bacterium]